MKLREMMLIVGLISTCALGCKDGGDDAKKPDDKTEKTETKKAEGPSINLDKKAYAAGDTIEVSFGGPLDKSQDKHWLTLVKAGSPDNEWGAWHMVKSGAKSDSLKTTEGGSFEVRLHAGYPKKQNNIVARKKVTVSGDKSMLSLDKSSYKKGDSIPVKFAKALPAKGGKYWLTLVKADAPENTWGKWHMVDAGKTEDALEAKEAGRYEVRLHGEYPTKQHNIIAKKPVTIE